MQPLPFYPDIIIRLGSAIVFGGAIGLEREFHGRPAGIRTHILVCLGATMIMFLPQLLHVQIGDDAGSIVNVQGRIIAGIVTGIGFLGAGAIIRIGDMVRGLTTAAGIWFTAALGAVIGSGYILLALVCTGAGMFITIFFEKVEETIQDTQYRELVLKVNNEDLQKIEFFVEEILLKRGVEFLDKYYKWEKSSNELTVKYMVKTKNVEIGKDIIISVQKNGEVSSAAWQKTI